MSIVHKFKKGLAWGNVINIYQMVLKFGVGIYLARTIDPFYFGQVGMVKAIISVLFSFRMFGETPAIYRQQENINAFMSMLMSTRIAVLSVISAILYFLGSYNILPMENELYDLFIVLYVTQVLVCVFSLYENYMQKELMFKRCCMIKIISYTGGAVVAICLAYRGYNAWAIVWFISTQKLLNCLLVFIFSPKRFMPRFNLKLFTEFYHYSKYIFISNFTKRIRSQIDKLSIGKLIGKSELGFYSCANNLFGFIQQSIVVPLQFVFAPFIGAMRKERDKLNIFLFIILKSVTIIVLGAVTLLGLITPEVITLLYGEKWLPAAIIYRALMPFFFLTIVRAFISSFHLIDGNSKSVFLSNLISLVILSIMIFPALHYGGVIGVAIAVDVSVIAGFALLLLELRKVTNVSLRSIALMPVLLTVAATVCVALVSNFSNVVEWNDFLRLILKSVVFSSTFIGGILIFEKVFVSRVLKYLRVRNDIEKKNNIFSVPF